MINSSIVALSTPKQSKLMAHQSNKVTASVTSFSPQSHHNKPEEHEETKEKFDEDISLEEALSTL
tara:strand:+ start:244 stop:438 length:195 start_codon:yes stop_codon:yes gene_type:complete